MGWKKTLATLALLSSPLAVSSQSIICPYYSPTKEHYTQVPEHTHPKNGFSIMLDAGHYEKDYNGTKWKELKEYELTLQVVKELEPKLEHLGYTIYLSRTTNEAVNMPRKYYGGSRNRSTQELKARRALAKKLDVDMIISIHFNSHGWKYDLHGWETWDFGYNNYYKNRNNGKQFFKDHLTRYYSGPSRTLGNAIHNYITEHAPFKAERKTGIVSALMTEPHQELRDMRHEEKNKNRKQEAIVLLELAYLTNANDRKYIRENLSSFPELIAGAMTYNPFMETRVQPITEGLVNIVPEIELSTAQPSIQQKAPEIKIKKKKFFQRLLGTN